MLRAPLLAEQPLKSPTRTEVIWDVGGRGRCVRRAWARRGHPMGAGGAAARLRRASLRAKETPQNIRPRVATCLAA
jgi:hypothetical protein